MTFQHIQVRRGLAPALVALLLVLTPLLVLGQATEPDSEFVEECRRKILEVMQYKAEVDAGKAHPMDRLDDAIHNYENYGCTWTMFDAPQTMVTEDEPTPVTEVEQPVAAPVTTPEPAVSAIDPAFLAECQRKAQEVAYWKRRLDEGKDAPDDHFDDAIYNFLNYGCTWEMFG